MEETRHSPLEDLLPWALPAEDGNPAVSLGELRFVQQIGLRLRPPMPAYIGGVPLPLQPNRVAVMRGVRTLWLGPDEWLITAAEGAAPDLLSWIRRAAADRRGAVADRVVPPLPSQGGLAAARRVIEIERVELILARRRNRQIGVIPPVRVARDLVANDGPFAIQRQLAPHFAHGFHGVAWIE